MNIKLSAKMTKRFIFFFLTFYGILFIGTSIFLTIMIYKIATGFYYHDIRVLENMEMEWAITEDDNTYTMSDHLIDIAHRSGGVLQLLNHDGEVILSSKENDLPTQYSIQNLTSLVAQENVYSWTLENGLHVLFTNYTEADQLLDRIYTTEHFPEITKLQEETLKEKDAVFELFDEHGQLIMSSSPSESETLRLGDVLSVHSSLNAQKELIAYKTLANGDIAVVRMDNPLYQALDSIDMALFSEFAKWFGIFHVILLLFTLSFSLWIGQRFGKPVFFFLKWIEQLSQKNYERIESPSIRRKKDGRLKRKYRIYEDVDLSLEKLTTNLKNNELTIQKTDQLREDWISGLSHDLKTPLSSIYGYATFLASKDHDWSPNEVRSFAKTMMDKATYMDALINDLTYTYQLKNDAVALEKKSLSFFEYVESYLKRSDWQADIHFDGDKQGKVLIDPGRFDRVLDNLVGNALKHNPPNTPIHLFVQPAKDVVTLVVRDEGQGIPEDVIVNLFNRYYRGTNTTTDASGTGLGLTIAKQLVELHGGEVEASSSNEGTSILIHLPRVDGTNMNENDR
ncbi:HAMP domain-containing histidine kinase [Bacillaceae bacterium SIJ1]|uniref:sensor histidine kinase n=1 Tax=Litoribacterium kuwaitense TaxID=1398745 RepID=UPI0013EA214E|nr:HAMP domain-containing sensor histidine kinase [Litoribacterium kuwaitense]NGP46345.1 HAMP domain-containing histidine kinase [Litoribacterium kuwaitense]